MWIFIELLFDLIIMIYIFIFLIDLFKFLIDLIWFDFDFGCVNLIFGCKIKSQKKCLLQKKFSKKVYQLSSSLTLGYLDKWAKFFWELKTYFKLFLWTDFYQLIFINASLCISIFIKSQSHISFLFFCSNSCSSKACNYLSV